MFITVGTVPVSYGNKNFTGQICIIFSDERVCFLHSSLFGQSYWVSILNSFHYETVMLEMRHAQDPCFGSHPSKMSPFLFRIFISAHSDNAGG